MGLGFRVWDVGFRVRFLVPPHILGKILLSAAKVMQLLHSRQ